MSLREELIQFYGKAAVKDIEANPAFLQLCAKHARDTGFEPERQRIRTLAKDLERWLDGQTHQSQVKLSLQLLVQTNDDDERRNDYNELIKLRYRESWSDAQKAHYDHAVAIITGNVQYFLSFTQRNRTPPHVNVINSNHRYFIKDVFYNEEIPKEAFSEKNLLARAVWWLLESRGLKGFYFPVHEGGSSKVVARLQAHSDQMLTFIQLVQSASFDWRSQNFCHFEYSQSLVSKSCKKRLFLLGDERSALQQEWGNTISAIYKDWFNESISAVDGLELKPTVQREGAAIKHNRKQIDDLIVKQIMRIRDQLFESVPV
jgi:hypothetical protein